MKKKFSRILGVGLTIALLSSLMVVAAPVSGAAGTLAWGTESGMPSKSVTKNHLVSGSNVVDLVVAADNSVIWALTNGATCNYTLKSTDGGRNWARKSSGLDVPSLLAIAPDDADTVVIAGDTNVVKVTTNGGTTFSTLTGHGLDNIYAVAVSPLSAGVHYVVAAGIDISGARVVYFNLGSAVPSWTVASDYAGMDGDIAVRAVAFSPAFPSDKVMVTVSEDGTTQTLYEIYSFASKKWNHEAGFGDYDGTKNAIALVPPLKSASISLYPTYLGADEAERKAFVGLTDNAGTDGGLYRMTDEADKPIGATTATTVHSVDYDGTNLVAGSYANNIGYRSANPTATNPTVSGTSLYQRPGGGSATVVAWNGDDVVAGTSGASSAFAVSEDNGKTFNDISLIDTALTNINDVAVTADASTVYMVTDDGSNNLSLWRKVSVWERVINLTDTGYIVRIAPDDADNVYLADLGSTTIYYSSDGAETNWMLRALSATPVDLAVESAEVAYSLDSAGKVYKTTNAGFIWASGKSTGITGATIVSLSEDNILVGGLGGGVAWSTDGNASSTTWTAKTSVISGNMQVAASGLADGDYIYAASGGANKTVKRWKLGTSTSWSTISTAFTNSYATYGLVLSGGTLYSVSSNGTDSGLFRTISPTTATSTSAWDEVTSAGKLFTKTPQALKVSTGSNKLWAIDDGTTADTIYAFIDTAFDAGPTLKAPEADASSGVNPVTGRAADIVFSWERLSKATAYKLYIAYDSAFKESVTTVTKSTTSSTVVQSVGPYQEGGKDEQVEFMPGTTYYWRVKATAPVTSPYSETRSFTVVSIDVFTISGPAAGASDVALTPTFTWVAYPDAIGYEIALSEDTTFTILEWSYNVSEATTFYKTKTEDALRYSTTYYWRVRGVTGEAAPKQAAPGGPWVTGVFTTMAEPVEEEPIVITEPGEPGKVTVIEVPVQGPAQAIPNWMLLTIIGIGAVLLIALIVLIVRTRRVA